MNYKQQIAAGMGLLGSVMTAYTMWKSAIYYGKFPSRLEGALQRRQRAVSMTECL